MSRIGKKPVAIPDGTKIALQERTVEVEGPLGKLTYDHRPEVSISIDDEQKEVVVTRHDDERQSRAYHGLTRALINNMFLGVTKGFEKKLAIVGVGYLAAIENDVLQLRVGFANEIHKKIPKNLKVACPDQTHIVVSGCSKQQVGQQSAP